MNRHAKASSSGSSTRQSKSLGAVVRGAFATRGEQSNANGSGAPKARLLLASIAVLALVLALGVAVASAVAPTVSVNNAQNITYTEAFVTGSINPEGKATSYRFQYATAPDFSDAINGLQGNLKEETSALGVSGELTGLQAHTTYYLRLVAENADGTNEAIAASSFETLEADTPLINRTFVSGIGGSEATLNAQINPRGAATTYHFQYVDQAGYEASEFDDSTSTPNQLLSAGASPSLIVTAGISGLEPGTTYYYRVLASNSKGDVEGFTRLLRTSPNVSEEPDSCPNAARRAEQQATELPDCRAWEMASPADKNGIDVVPMPNRTRAAADGSAVNFATLVGFGDVHGGTLGTESIAQRTAAPGTSGWQTHGITPAQNPLTPFASTQPNLDPAYDLLSSDLSAGVFRALRPITDAPNVAGQLNLYTRKDLRTPGAGSYQLISDPGFAVAPLAFPQHARPYVAGASSDFSHVIFESKLPLDEKVDPSSCSPFVGCPVQLFESVDGAVRLAGRVPPPGQSECDDATKAPACEAAPTSQAGRGFLDGGVYNPHMISADGSHVFFQAPAGGGNIYMRVNGTTTVQLNVSERSTKEDASGATLWTASADGSRVFFSSGAGLVDEDEDHAEDYYMYDVDAPAGEHLTLVSGGADGAAPIGVIGASEDGHYLYFMMAGQLVPGEGPSFGFGIYVWHDGNINFIGDFAQGGNWVLNTLASNWGGTDSETRARVSADGSHVTFAATDDGGFRGRGGFTGYDHGTACSGFGCQELYVYNANDGKLRCASCNPSGALPTGRVRVGYKAENYASALASTPYLNHALSADGHWAFFTSPDPLVPEDTNGKYDAYSYDTVNDEVHLLSSGTSDDDSYFMDASADGRDAFFTTREQLVGWDIDKSLDLYDARVGGGVPEPAPVPAPCEGDSCHAASAAAPGAAPLGSTQPGLGNPKPPRRCAKGKHTARKAGKTRCVPNRNKRNAKNNRRAGR